MFRRRKQTEAAFSFDEKFDGGKTAVILKRLRPDSEGAARYEARVLNVDGGDVAVYTFTSHSLPLAEEARLCLDEHLRRS
jgi:hypothetical protein